MKSIAKFTYTIAAAIAAAILIISFVGGVALKVRAATSAPESFEYSEVLNDLKKDENFSCDDYPENSSDYSLKVIQIGESVNGEMFIYVYQPSGQKYDLRASSVNIAREQNDSASLLFKNYELKFVNCSEVFYKYVVQDFEVKKDVVRYYNISNILRPFNKQLGDKTPNNVNTVSEVPYKVGQFWTACTLNGEVSYTMTESETIEVTKKYVGFVNYQDGVDMGWAISGGITSAHFVAFSTDKPIEKLLSVDIGFMEQHNSCKLCTNIAHLNHKFNSFFDYNYGDKEKHNPYPVTLKYDDKKGGNIGGGGFISANKYEWNRIRKTSEFLADSNTSEYRITSEGEKDISGTDWVLSFYETQVEYKLDNVWAPLLSVLAIPFVGDSDVRLTTVSDVMLLRLEFETEGKYYNLGVVDNKQTGDGEPDNEPVEDSSGTNIIGNKIKNLLKPIASDIKNFFKSISWWIWVIVGCAVVAVVLIVLSIAFPAFGMFLLKMITAPFRFIASLFKQRSKSRARTKQNKRKGKRRVEKKAGKRK